MKKSIQVSGGLAILIVGFGAGHFVKTEIDRPTADVGKQSSTVEATSLKRLIDQQAMLKGQLDAIHASVSQSKQEIANFQIFIHKLQQGEDPRSEETLPDDKKGTSQPRRRPAKEQGPATAATTTPERVVPDLSILDGRAAVEEALGLPDRVDGNTLNYYEKGIRVELDEFGGVVSASFYGFPYSDSMDMNGNYGSLFTKKGRWYRPSRWQMLGLDIGMGVDEVIRILGPCDHSLADINGNWFLGYKERHLVVLLDASYRVRGFKMSQNGDLESDVNGNVR